MQIKADGDRTGEAVTQEVEQRLPVIRWLLVLFIGSPWLQRTLEQDTEPQTLNARMCACMGTEVSRRVATLKPLAGDVNNIYPLVIIPCSAGNILTGTARPSSPIDHVNNLLETALYNGIAPQ